MDDLIYTSSGEDYSSSTNSDDSDSDGIPEEISAKLFAPIPGSHKITMENEQDGKAMHPQQWLQDKYGKKKKKKLVAEEIPFFQMYGKQLNTPEDIAKYREERIKNFPTRENIERKKLEQQEKLKRGIIKKPEKKLKPPPPKFRGRQPNLLVALLEKEVEKENDMTLQVVRYVIKKRFFCDTLSTRVESKLKAYESIL